MPSTGLGLDLRVLSDRSVVSVHGELDLATAPMLSQALAELPARHAGLEIDLRHLTFIDCSGITALLAARTSNGPGEVVLSHPTPLVARVFDLLAVHEHMRIEP